MGRLFEYIQLAVDVILSNKRRSFLTTLGITIGVFNVILVISVLSGGRALILEEVGSLGSNVISIYPLSDEYLTQQDISKIRKIPQVVDILPEEYIMTQLKIKKEKRDVFVDGVSHRLNRVVKIEIITGRFLRETDELLKKKVCVITEGLKRELFGKTNAIGKEIKIEGNIFRVIGIAKEKVLLKKVAGDMIFIPFGTLKRILGTDKIWYLTITVKEIEMVDETLTRIKKVLNEEYFGKEKFGVSGMKEIVDTTKMVTGIIALVIICIAAISLIVGGIGIMNIMLVSIRERMREVGIRKAFGATNGDILLQFLIESCILSLLGGFMGIIFGLLVANILAIIIKIPLIINWGCVFLGFLVSFFVGIIFGIFPARFASKLDPIEVMRYE